MHENYLFTKIGRKEKKEGKPFAIHGKESHSPSLEWMRQMPTEDHNWEVALEFQMTDNQIA